MISVINSKTEKIKSSDGELSSCEKLKRRKPGKKTELSKGSRVWSVYNIDDTNANCGIMKISGSSAATERKFSMIRHTQGISRNRLSASHIESEIRVKLDRDYL